MKRRILIVLLALGTVGGYAAGFAHLHHHCHANTGHHPSGCDDRGDSR